LKKFISAFLIAMLASLSPGIAGAAKASTDSTTSSSNKIDVYGFEVSWPDAMYFPVGCSNFEFKYRNNVGSDLLQVGFILTDPYGDKVADDSLIGAPNGGSGVWNKQICVQSLNNGLGPYVLKVYIRDYDSRGGNTREATAQITFKARPGTSAPVIPVAPPVTGSTQELDVYGFKVSWPAVLYFPTGCSNFEFKYRNEVGFDLLQVGFILSDPYGDKVADDSLIGAPNGGSGTWNEQICVQSLKNGLGPYVLKVYIRDYDSRGGITREASSSILFTKRPTASPGVPDRDWITAGFSSCTTLNKVYRGGVSKSKASKNKGAKTKYKPSISPTQYALALRFDEDKDGIACER
jgi:hypothetical protein